NIDIHDDVPSRRQHAIDLSPQRTIQVAVHLRRFGEVAFRLTALEVLEREKMVVAAIYLSLSGRTGCAGYRVPDVRSHRQQLVGDRRLSAPGRRRQNDRERHYSRFSTCSRIRSSSSLIAITSSWIWASLALLPTVFASRTIS